MDTNESQLFYDLHNVWHSIDEKLERIATALEKAQEPTPCDHAWELRVHNVSGTHVCCSKCGLWMKV